MANPDSNDDTCRTPVAAYLARAGFVQNNTATHELAGDASDRRYVRVIPTEGSSFILLIHRAPIDPLALPFLNVARLLQRISVPVPEVFGHEADLGILILEDLGDVTLEASLLEASPRQRSTRYAEAVSLLVHMQERAHEFASPEFVPFGLSFDVKKLISELDFFVQQFLIGHRRVSLSSTHRTDLAVQFAELSETLATEPRVLCHRDYHSRNLMVHDSQLYVIDFQDARMGPNTYDLVSLLRDSYVDLEPDFVEQMIELFLKSTGSSDVDSFTERFDRMSIQRHLKALGTFGYQIAALGEERYGSAIPRTLGYITEVFERRPRFDQLRTVLATHIPELG